MKEMFIPLQDQKRRKESKEMKANLMKIQTQFHHNKNKMNN